MDRRNFIGALLTIGAGFSILPGAGRLWVPERTILLGPQGIASIWKTHYISYPERSPDWSHMDINLGKIYCKGDRVWIKSDWGDLPLRKMRRPLSWDPHPDSLTFYQETVTHRWNNDAYEHIMPVQPASVHGGPEAQV